MREFTFNLSRKTFWTGSPSWGFAIDALTVKGLTATKKKGLLLNNKPAAIFIKTNTDSTHTTFR